MAWNGGIVYVTVDKTFDHRDLYSGTLMHDSNKIQERHPRNVRSRSVAAFTSDHDNYCKMYDTIGFCSIINHAGIVI